MSVDVERLRAVTAEATGGRWVTYSPGATAGDPICGWDGNDDLGEGPCGGFHATGPSVWTKEQALRDAVYIAAASPATMTTLLDENERLRTRQQELLRDFARITQQMPFPDEANQVPTLIAEVGTLRAANAKLQLERDAMRDILLKATVIDMPHLRAALTEACDMLTKVGSGTHNERVDRNKRIAELRRLVQP